LYSLADGTHECPPGCIPYNITEWELGIRYQADLVISWDITLEVFVKMKLVPSRKKNLSPLRWKYAGIRTKLGFRHAEKLWNEAILPSLIRQKDYKACLRAAQVNKLKQQSNKVWQQAFPAQQKLQNQLPEVRRAIGIGGQIGERIRQLKERAEEIKKAQETIQRINRIVERLRGRYNR
jgi:hypothetical protein